MVKDITSRKEIDFIVHTFYGLALKDALLSPVFEMANLDLAHHLPVISDFWESILLDNPIYRGNPMIVHMALHRKIALTEDIFERWMTLWIQTINENFKGKTADLAISRAQSIKALMMHKINMIKPI